MQSVLAEIQAQLFELQDLKYKDFHCKLMPTINPDKVIGVRIPELRKLAKKLSKESCSEKFLAELPHQYYEENNLHSFLLETIKDYDTAIELTKRFLQYIDNWATCDSFSPKVFKKHLPELYERILTWLKSEETYTVRYGIGMLMSHYLDDAFEPKILAVVADIHSSEYYINMMIAWYFATALAKQYEAAIVYIQQRRLDEWTHNKAIQKAIESNRIDVVKKEYLRTLKINKTKSRDLNA